MRARFAPRASPFALLLGAFAGWLAAFNVRVALGVIGAALVAILVFIGAEFLLLGVVAVEPWADALQFPTKTVTIPKIVGVLALASWLLAAMTGRAPVRFAPQIGWAYTFLLVVVISLMLSANPTAGVTKTISYALYVTFLALFVQQITNRRKVQRCLAVYAASATAAAAYALYRFATGAVHLASGPIGDPNDFGLFLATAIPMAVYFVRNSRRRLPWILALMVLVAATLATFSRGALVGFAAVLVWGIVSRRISLPGVLGGVLAVSIVLGCAVIFFQPLIQERLVQKSVVANRNVASRKVFWEAAWHMAIDHPVVGVGPGRFGTVSKRYVLNDPIVLHNPAVHNSYLEILAEDGPFALALFLCFIGSAWRALRKARREAVLDADLVGRRLADTLMASLLWASVSMTFISKQLSIPIWLVGGLAGSLALALREPRQPARTSKAVVPPGTLPPAARLAHR